MIFSTMIFTGSAGLLCGLVIAFSIKRLTVHGDIQRSKILTLLPGINCASCGYVTCSAFARAIAEGKVLPTGCIHINSKIAHDLADIMGITIVTADPHSAVVHCKGGKAEATDRSKYEGIHDCNAAILVDNGSKTCTDGCLGFGTCVKTCSFDALSVNKNGVAVVDPEKCTGCGRCVESCPRLLISLIPRHQKIFLACSNHDHGVRVKKYCSLGCTACSLCIKAAAPGSIIMINNLPVLDYSSGEIFVAAAHRCPAKCFTDLLKARPKANIDVKCDGCGKCPPCCPTEAIAGYRGERHVVDKNLCIGCGICIDKCHARAISLYGGGASYTAENRNVRHIKYR